MCKIQRDYKLIKMVVSFNSSERIAPIAQWMPKILFIYNICIAEQQLLCFKCSEFLYFVCLAIYFSFNRMFWTSHFIKNITCMFHFTLHGDLFLKKTEKKKI